MNKNCYRIIFSKAKNMFVAVAENIKSHTKTTGQSSGLNRQVKSEICSFHQTWQVKSLVASMSLLMSFTPVYAQMLADPNAQASQKASIGVGQNPQGQSIPIVNIQTPKNGVSHNVYSQFDVLQPGVVLNNSRTGATSVLVGRTTANPYLNTGEARLILNEVNSSTASQFKGNLEVAGQRADVIIANPSGINIQGGGFINANKVTFTTGKPQMNADGSIQQFVVDQGKITVSANPNSNLGLGGSASTNANYVDIYTRALELNAQMHAKEGIQVITGTNAINADLTNITPNASTPAPSGIALDVKGLGGMYAKSIYVMGTEKGLGVSNAGILQSVNNLVITSAGKIEHTGQMYSTNGSSTISLATTNKGTDGDINISGKISAYGGIQVNALNDLNVNTPELILESTGNRNVKVNLTAQENFNLSSLAKVQNLGGKETYITARNINLGIGSQLINKFDSINMNAENNLITEKDVKILVEKNANLSANQVLIKGSEVNSNRESLNIQSSASNTNNNLIQINDSTLNAYKAVNIYSTGDVQIKNINNSSTIPVSFLKDLNIYSGMSLGLNLDRTVNQLNLNGNLRLEAEKFINLNGTQLFANGSITAIANGIEFNKKIEGYKGIDLNSKLDLNLVNDSILTSNSGSIKLTSLEGNVNAQNLKANSTESVSIIAYKDINLSGVTTNKANLTSRKDLTLASASGSINLVNTDLKSNSGSIFINSPIKANLIDISMNASKNIELYAKDDLMLDGVNSIAQVDTVLNSKKNIYINSQAGVNGAAVFNSTKKSQFQSNRILSVTTDKNINVQNVTFQGGAVLAEAGESLNTGKLTSIKSMGSTVLNTDEQLKYLNGNLAIQTGNNLTIDPKNISLDADKNLELTSKNGVLTLLGYSANKGRSSAEVVKLNSSNGSIRLEGNSIELQGSKITAAKDINLISQAGDIALTAIKNNVINDRPASVAAIAITNAYLDVVFQIKQLEKPIQGTISTEEYLRRVQLLNSYRAKRVDIENKLAFFASYNDGYYNYYKLNGYEHDGTLLLSNYGNINFNSAKGISVSSSDLTANNGMVNIDSNGSLNSTMVGGDNQQTSDKSIVIDAVTDFYAKGNQGDANYSTRSYDVTTKITGNNGINIRGAISTNSDTSIGPKSNIFIKNAILTTKDKDVNISGNSALTLDQVNVDNNVKVNLFAKDNISLVNLINSNTTDKAGEFNINSGKNVLFENLKLNNNLWSVDVSALGDLNWKNALPISLNSLNLRSNGKLDLSNSQFITNSNLNFLGKEIFLSKDLTSNGKVSIAAIEGDINLTNNINAKSDIAVTAEKGNIIGSSLKIKSDEGKAELYANKNIQLGSNQKTTVAVANQSEVITDKTAISGKQGITLASTGDGLVKLRSADITAENGIIRVIGGKGIQLDTNKDIVYVGGYATERIVNNNLNANEIFLGNRGSEINVKNTNLISTVNGIQIQSDGDTRLRDSSITAKGNIELFAKDNLVINGVQSNSQSHTALNANRVLINADTDFIGQPIFTDGTTITNFNSNGILSVTSKDSIYTQNAKLTGGAVLVEAVNSFVGRKDVELTATGSELLRTDDKLNQTDGDLVVQSNYSLYIDPRTTKLKAAGDIELISKNGETVLLGYGGNNGAGSEEVVNLDAENGGIYIQGQIVALQGSNLKANKSIKLVSTDGDIFVDAVKNTVNNSPSNYYKNRAQSEIDLRNYTIGSLNAVLTLASQGGQVQQIMLAMLGGEQKVRDYIANQNAIKAVNVRDFNFYSSNLNGFEHKTAKLTSNTGDIELNSENGILVRGADLNAAQNILIESKGRLARSATSRDTSDQFDTGILIDGVIDGFELGNDSNQNYSVRENFKAGSIQAGKDIKIRSLGNAASSNLVIQAADINSKNGDIRLESDNNIVLLTGQDQSYDRSSNTTTKKTWYGKKKITTTTTEYQDYSADPVELSAKNIWIKSKGDAVLYSTNMQADSSNGGRIDIQAKNIKLLVTDEVNKVETSSRTKSSFWGIKYNDTKTNSSYKEITQLPVKAKADYISTKSDFDTLIRGAEFNYLSGASIQAGGTITLEPATNRVETAKTKESNSVVWQSMQDKGSVTETAKLPSFNGPTPPVFQANGGLIVQIPIGEQDQNKVQIRDEILKLANQPGNEYLRDLVNRNDVDWNKIILAQKNWDYKAQGLTGVGAAIIVIIVAVITYGAGTAAVAGAAGTATGGTTVGMGASMLGTAGVTTTTVGGVTTITGVSTLGAMANAAVTSIATNASISLINNGGDVAATLKELGSKEAIKGLATSVVTAGVISQLGNLAVMKDLGNMTQSTDFLTDIAGRTGTALINAGVSSVVNTGINGGSLSENLEAALLNGLTSSLQGSVSEQIGLKLDLDNKTLVDEILHKVAHIAAGCVAGAIQQQCEAGAIGAGVGEIMAGFFEKPADTASQQEKEAFRAKVLAATKVVSGTVAALTGYDVNIAASSAESAVSNNYLTAQQVKNFYREANDCRNDQGCLKNVDNKYFGKTTYDSNGNVISGFYGANQEAFRNCNTTECRIQHGTALIAGQLAYNELNQGSINSNLWIKAKSYVTNGGITSYVNDKDQAYVNGVSQVLGFIEAKCGGALNEACQAKWIERNDQQLSAFLTLGGLLLSPAILKTVSYSASSLRSCLVSLTCSTNLKLIIDGAITDGSIYGAGATAVTLPSKQILQKESSKLGTILANAFKLETPDASLGLCFSGKECFVAGTLIETSEGLKSIEKFIGGELVWSRNDMTMAYEYNPVIGLSRTENQPIYEVIIKHPSGKQEKIETTQEHPFWVKGVGWLKASLLKSGMVVYDRNDAPLTIVNQVLLAKVDTVYNIEVESTHTYHVGELGVWVHNACCNIESLKYTLQKLQANGENPLLKNGGNKIIQISNNLMKDPDVDNLFRIINLPQIQNAKGAADLMSAYYSSTLRPSVIQALNYADDIVKSNPKAIIEFEAVRINGIGTTDIIVKNAQGVITHAIELKGLDTITPTNVSRNINEAIGQLYQAQNAQTRIARIEVRNGYSSTLSSDVITQIQISKNKNPSIKIEIQFADGVVKVW